MACLSTVFSPCLTDTVFRTEITTNRINPRTGEKNPEEAAKIAWATQNHIPILKTGHFAGKDRGERSIVAAVDKVSEALRQRGIAMKIYIASDDNFFRRGEEGECYEAIRFTSKNLINLVNRLYNIPIENRAGVKITPPVPR